MECEFISEFKSLAENIRSKYFRIIRLNSKFQYYFIVYVEFDVDASVRLEYKCLDSMFSEVGIQMLDSKSLRRYSELLSKIEEFEQSGLFEIEDDVESYRKFRTWARESSVGLTSFVDTRGDML